MDKDILPQIKRAIALSKEQIKASAQASLEANIEEHYSHLVATIATRAIESRLPDIREGQNIVLSRLDLPSLPAEEERISVWFSDKENPTDEEISWHRFAIKTAFVGRSNLDAPSAKIVLQVSVLPAKRTFTRYVNEPFIIRVCINWDNNQCTPLAETIFTANYDWRKGIDEGGKRAFILGKWVRRGNAVSYKSRCSRVFIALTRESGSLRNESVTVNVWLPSTKKERLY